MKTSNINTGDLKKSMIGGNNTRHNHRNIEAISLSDESSNKIETEKNPNHSNQRGDFKDMIAAKIAQLELQNAEKFETTIEVLDDPTSNNAPSMISILLEDENKNANEKIQDLSALVRSQGNTIKNLKEKISELHGTHVLILKEKSRLAEELNKLNVAKSRTEQLCRELQKQNKLIVLESNKVAQEEDNKRRGLSRQFEKTITEVGHKMDQQGKNYLASLKENESLQQQLKGLLEQYAVREEQFQHQLKAKDLNIQLLDAKLHHQIELTLQEGKKTEAALQKARDSASREMELQSQLATYAEKFDVVQETLSKSNNMFVTFRKEMESMTKHIKKIEKENLSLKTKCAEYDQGAIQAIQDGVSAAEDKKKLEDKIMKLESLCRVLQAERKRAVKQDAAAQNTPAA